MITGKLYNYLKWLAQVVLPAVGALYVALAGLWGLPAAQQVAGTILAVDTFLGIILGISQVAYSNATMGGEMHVSDTPQGLGYNLVLDDLPEDLKDKQEVRFKVKHVASLAVPEGAKPKRSAAKRRPHSDVHDET